MKSLRWVAAGACAIATAGLGGAASAWPTSSYTSNMMPYNRASCLDRAARALATGGWTARPTGGPEGQIGLVGHKEPNAAYILCLDVSNFPVPPGAAAPSVGTTVLVFVTSTAPNAAIPADEAAKLQQLMLQQ